MPKKQDIKTQYSATEFVKYSVRNNLLAFATYMEPYFECPYHIREIANKLMQLEKGEIKKLAISMPPRFGKSQLTSRLFPAWVLGRNSNSNIIFSTYAQDFADDFGRVVRNYLADEKFKYIFENCNLSRDSASVKKFSINEGGGYFAVGAGGPITGRGGDIVILDDVHKNREEANSKTIRKKIIDWFNSTLYTRLSPEGRIVIIGTRWHEDDLIGNIKDSQDDFEIINMPALDENNNSLWPSQWPLKRLEKIKKDIGTYEWNALYQQRPVPEEGGIIKKEWIKTYKELPYVLNYSWSWDTAIKSGSDNDYSVGLLFAECENGYYLVDMYREKLEYPELRKMVQAFYNKHPSAEVLVEDKASGQQIVQDFKRLGNMPVIPVVPGKDMPKTKEERMRLVSPSFEAGKVFIPEDAKFFADFVSEVVYFPSVKHDDICDAMTQYLARKLNSQRRPNIRVL